MVDHLNGSTSMNASKVAVLVTAGAVALLLNVLIVLVFEFGHLTAGLAS
jgi:hypothetical protein